MNPIERLRIWAASGILIAWLAGLVADALLPTYRMDPGLTAAALAVAAFLFSPSFGRERRNGKDKPDD